MNLLGKRTSKQPANVHAQCVSQTDYDALKQQLDQSNSRNREWGAKILELENEIVQLKQKINDLEEELDRPIIG